MKQRKKLTTNCCLAKLIHRPSYRSIKIPANWRHIFRAPDNKIMAKEIHKLFIAIIISTNINSLCNDEFFSPMIVGHSERTRKWIGLIELWIIEKMNGNKRKYLWRNWFNPIAWNWIPSWKCSWKKKNENNLNVLFVMIGFGKIIKLLWNVVTLSVDCMELCLLSALMSSISMKITLFIDTWTWPGIIKSIETLSILIILFASESQTFCLIEFCCHCFGCSVRNQSKTNQLWKLKPNTVSSIYRNSIWRIQSRREMGVSLKLAHDTHFQLREKKEESPEIHFLIIITER